MHRYGKTIVQSAPLLHLLPALTTGIICQFYFPSNLFPLLGYSFLIILGLGMIHYANLVNRFRLRWLSGIFIHLLIACLGSITTYNRDITNKNNWIGHHHRKAAPILVTLLEPPAEKNKSFKALAKINAVWSGSKWSPSSGNILLYFRKGSHRIPCYGTKLIIQKALQPVSSLDNPGGFDYRRYCALQNVYHQVFLEHTDYKLLEVEKSFLTEKLFAVRNWILTVLEDNIAGAKERGIAAALLIGYRNNLDKDLLQSYSNTGVVHIIAISGLHLGMIYGLILLLFHPLQYIRLIKWPKPVLTLTVLWTFSFLAGAAPSILRSAVMFSFIITGEIFSKRTNAYNSLAASAFCLLIYDPYFLWDIGFQLSYAAVLGIMLLMKPIYKCFYYNNRLLNRLWQLNAVTLAAQIATFPMILYYFHQFPNLFLLTNFFIVPLSGCILYGCMALLITYKMPVIGRLTGGLVSWLIKQMNGIIERSENIPYAIAKHVKITLMQQILLYASIIAVCYWLLFKRNKGLIACTGFLIVFTIYRFIDIYKLDRQKQVIVYDIPNHTAIEFFTGSRSRLIGDSALLTSRELRQSFLTPCHIQYRIINTTALPVAAIANKLVTIRNKRILLIDKAIALPPWTCKKIPVDIIILSNNPRVYIGLINKAFDCKLYIFDSSNPLWKIQYWKKDADSLHLRHHSVSEQGAFEMVL